jgi:hypothetical protein
VPEAEDDRTVRLLNGSKSDIRQENGKGRGCAALAVVFCNYSGQGAADQKL